MRVIGPDLTVDAGGFPSYARAGFALSRGLCLSSQALAGGAEISGDAPLAATKAPVVSFNCRGPHQARDCPFPQRQAYAGHGRDGRPPGRGLITRVRRPADGCIPEAHILPHRGWLGYLD